jgi:hypothetical protein
MFPKEGDRKRQKNVLLLNFQDGKTHRNFISYYLQFLIYNSKICVAEKRKKKKA